MLINSHINASLYVEFLEINSRSSRLPVIYHFLYMKKGSISIQFPKADERMVLNEGELHIVRPGVEHIYDYFSDNLILNVSVDASFVDSYVPLGYYLDCSGKSTGIEELKSILTSIALNFNDSGSQLTLCAHLYRLIDCLTRHFLVKSDADVDLSVTERRLATINSFIRQNYHLPIAIKDLAGVMFLTPQYLSRFIKKQLNRSFSQILNEVRLKHAMLELMQTDNAIGSVAYNNGFPRVAVMSSAFKEKLGITAGEYRAQNRIEHAEPSEPGQLSADKATPIEAASRRKVRAKMNESIPLTACWQDTINIGQLSVTLSQSFRNAFTECRKRLGFRYVRFQNIFDANILEKTDSPGDFNFANINQIFDFFESSGAVPFIELSFKPKKSGLVEQAAKTGLYQGEQTIDYYADLLQVLLTYCVNRYGWDYISKWRFEVWLKNDEDLKPLETISEYIAKYQRLRSVVKSIAPACAVGGPGFNGSADHKNLRRLMSDLSAAKVRFDFISIYAFAYESSRYDIPSAYPARFPFGIISPDRGFYATNFRQLKAIVQSYYGDAVPVWITEFSSCLTLNNCVSNSVFQGAFLCHNMLSLFPETDCVAYWTLQDNAIRSHPSAHEFYSGFGLLDAAGVPKPSFYAYAMLVGLGTRLIARGENYIISAKSENSFQILAFNYVHFNLNYCMDYLEPVSLENTYSVFEDTDVVKLDLQLDQLTSGRFKVTRNTLSRQYGSPLDDYIRLYHEGMTSAELSDLLLNMQDSEAAYFKRTSVPRQDISYVNCDGSIDFHLELSPHEIIAIDLMRLM